MFSDINQRNKNLNSVFSRFDRGNEIVHAASIINLAVSEWSDGIDVPVKQLRSTFSTSRSGEDHKA